MDFNDFDQDDIDLETERKYYRIIKKRLTKKGYWKTAEGKLIKIVNLDDVHLDNIINMFRKRAASAIFNCLNNIDIFTLNKQIKWKIALNLANLELIMSTDKKCVELMMERQKRHPKMLVGATKNES